MRLGIAEIHLVDDGKHRYLEQDGVQPWAYDGDVQPTVRQRRHGDVLFIQPEQAQEIDKVAFDKAHGAQVVQLVWLKVQAAQRLDFTANFIGVGSEIDAGVATFEAVLHLRTRELVQHHLHHGELVQVGIQQAGNDHGVTVGAQ